jgi:uncharacterized protein (DUF4415 family)
MIPADFQPFKHIYGKTGKVTTDARATRAPWPRSIIRTRQRGFAGLFKRGGEGYQTRINAAPREYVERHQR